MKLQEMKEELNADTISKRGDVYTIRVEFFYTHGFTSEKLARRVIARFPNAEIVEHHENWAPFRGGANTYNSSHWMVSFKLPARSEEMVVLP
jgi:hypothetical protein